MFAALRAQARRLKQHTLTVWFAARDPRTPRLVRWLAFGVAAYALSPIDLIPDFIPVLGYLDDVLLVPLGLALVLRLTPPEVRRDAEARAAQVVQRPTSRGVAVLILLIWLLLAALALRWLWGVAGWR